MKFVLGHVIVASEAAVIQFHWFVLLFEFSVQSEYVACQGL